MRVIITGIGILLSFSVLADNSDSCQYKEIEIYNQIIYANKYNNIQEVAGLQAALEQVRTHCHGHEFSKRVARKVEEKKLKLAERQQELAEAQADGRVKKIWKAERKLEAAKYELKEALDSQFKYGLTDFVE